MVNVFTAENNAYHMLQSKQQNYQCSKVMNIVLSRGA